MIPVPNRTQNVVLHLVDYATLAKLAAEAIPDLIVTELQAVGIPAFTSDFGLRVNFGRLVWAQDGDLKFAWIDDGTMPGTVTEEQYLEVSRASVLAQAEKKLEQQTQQTRPRRAVTLE
jgi:hypothetical protein